MNVRKEQCERCGYAGSISYAATQPTMREPLTPREMIDMAGDIANYAMKKARESGKDISGRDMGNVLAIVGLLLPDA